MSEGALPTGTVTFLLTDIEGSTKLWQWHEDVMRRVVERHDELIATSVAEHGGVFVKSKGEGDSTFSVFTRPSDAVDAAVDAQRALATEPWPHGIELTARAALHTGEAELRDGDYYGTSVNRCARLRGIGHGGQVICSQATAELVSDALPQSISFLDLGSHRLRDIARPERVYQICADGLRTIFPPLLSIDSSRTNLAAQRTSFVGRQAEVADVRKRLEQDRLVTLTGVGGCGKTRLAQHVGAEELDRFADGVWFVDLAPVSEPAAIMPALAKAIGLVAERDMSMGAAGPVRDRIFDYLSPRSALVILDNCEHLVRACAEAADEILASCPNVKILATSREALEVDGERPYSVPSLGTSDDSSDAVVLFGARAEAVRPGFAVTSENVDHVAEVCRRLDGIPLAIELAAAQVSHLSPHQIASRLDDRFGLLTGGRQRVQRQQTLAATLDWSFELLNESERTLLRRLAVFPGTFTLEAAEAVCGDDLPAPLAWVRSLVGKSLVVTEEAGVDLRYRLLETVRLYVEAKLVESGEAEHLRRRHRDYYLLVAERLSEEFGWSELDAEHHNTAAALAWSEREGRLDLVARLAVAVALDLTLDVKEAVRWLALGMSAVDELEPEQRFRFLACHCVTSMTALGGSSARDSAQRVVEEFGERTETNLWVSIAYGVFALLSGADGLVQNTPSVQVSERLGIEILKRAGEPLAAEVMRLGDRAVALAPTPFGRAIALTLFGQALTMIGRIAEAISAFEEVLSIYDNRRPGDIASDLVFGESTQAALAYLYLMNGRADDALGIAPSESAQAGDWPIWTLSARYLAVAENGRHDEALESMRELTARPYAFRVPAVRVMGLVVLAAMAHLRGENERAYVLAATSTVNFLQGSLRTPLDLALALHYAPSIRKALDDATAKQLAARGYAMTLDDATAYGLEQDG